jgi:hypothetical protein
MDVFDAQSWLPLAGPDCCAMTAPTVAAHAAAATNRVRVVLFMCSLRGVEGRNMVAAPLIRRQAAPALGASRTATRRSLSKALNAEDAEEKPF